MAMACRAACRLAAGAGPPFAAIGGAATPLSANLVRSARIVAATFEAGDDAILGTYAALKRHAHGERAGL